MSGMAVNPVRGSRRFSVIPGLEGVRGALQVFSAHRLRTVLAMLGVFLGALLLTLITHVLGGVTLLIEEQGRALGSHTVTLTPAFVLFTRDNGAASSPAAADEEEDTGLLTIGEGVGSGDSPAQSAATLTLEDMESLVRSIPHVSGGVPFAKMSGQIHHGRKNSSCQILGVSAPYPAVRNVQTAHGRFFLEEEDQRKALVCVLGYALAERLFGDPATAPGQWIRIRYSSVQVVGVMEAKGADSTGTNMDEYVLAPIRTAMQRFSSQDHINGMYLSMRDKAHGSAIESALQGLLRFRHRLAVWEKDDFNVSHTGKIDEMITNALELVTMLGFIGAGISFSVGTLGVFSIMILMVHARKMEIGIRRAVGAPKRLILRQFLWEAGIMAGSGGLLGVLAALGVSQTISAFGLLPSYFSLPTAFGVCALSLVCGLVAGGYPAYKASRIEVLAALRD